jgi:hypothetical protein
MFFMARDALLIRDFEMIAALRIERRFYFLMTRQTFRAADFISRFVTLQTIRHSLKLLVRFRQLAWRELRNSILTLNDKEKQNKPPRRQDAKKSMYASPSLLFSFSLRLCFSAVQEHFQNIQR